MAHAQGSTGVKHLCCGEHSPVFPSNYCPFCGKSVHLYGVEVDAKGLGSFFADKLEAAGVKVNRNESWFPSRIGEEPPLFAQQSPLAAQAGQAQHQE